ncbi:MAG: flagellar biosynthesis protein FliQ [Gammaproteobacteria bacterium]|nr:flagellar biosynthesis protein FliQ [Gammaproteobacteria bacterium]
MTPEVAVDIIREALSVTSLVVAAIIVPSLLVGLMVAMFQAATQINEQTLSFLPRLLISFMTLIVLGPWLVGQWMEFTTRLIHNIPFVIG